MCLILDSPLRQLITLPTGVVVASHATEKFYLYPFDSILEQAQRRAIPEVIPFRPWISRVSVPYPSFVPLRQRQFSMFSLAPPNNERNLSLAVTSPANPTLFNPVILHGSLGRPTRSYSITMIRTDKVWSLALLPLAMDVDMEDNWLYKPDSGCEPALILQRKTLLGEEAVREDSFVVCTHLPCPFQVAHVCHVTGRTLLYPTRNASSSFCLDLVP